MAAAAGRPSLHELLESRFRAAMAAGLTRTKDLTRTRRAFLGPPPDDRSGPDVASGERLAESLTAQFNEEHIAAKRKTTMQAAAAAPPVLKPFDPSGFHFGKADPREILCAVTVQEDGTAELSWDGLSGLLEARPDHPWAGPHPVLVNASPLCSPHALLVPCAGRRLPQRLGPESLRVALALAAAPGAEALRVMFNSPGAWASVNHLHLHVVPAAFEHGGRAQSCLPVERSPTSPIAEAAAPGDVVLSVAELAAWPAWGLSFACEGPGEAASAALVSAVSGVVTALQSDDVAHNLLVADAGRRVVLLPRLKQSRTGDGTLNVAVMEICGRGIVNVEDGWAGLTAASLAEQLEEVRLPEDARRRLARAAAEAVRGAAEAE